MEHKKTVDIVFHKPLQDEEVFCFVEVESPPGVSVRFGEWVLREDGYTVLRFTHSWLSDEPVTPPLAFYVHPAFDEQAAVFFEEEAAGRRVVVTHREDKHWWLDCGREDDPKAQSRARTVAEALNAFYALHDEINDDIERDGMATQGRWK